MISAAEKSERASQPPPLSRIGDGECTGCSACANGCRRLAVTMVLSAEGFYRPLLNRKRCTGCLECIGHCPVVAALEGKGVEGREQAPEVYAAWSTDEKVHHSSSSGGIFSELARRVLERSGVVCGCAWGKGLTPCHVMVRQWNEVERLRGSKYLPSSFGRRVFGDLVEAAGGGSEVLFCGTPCQVAGLKRSAPAELRERLCTVDLVCHGVPSLASFRRYLEWKFGIPPEVEEFSFRCKELSSPAIRAKTGKGETYLNVCHRDPWFFLAMVHHLFLQPSCYQCRFRSVPRHGDLSLGDFWGIPEAWHHPRGDSVVLANSAKGAELLRELERDGLIRRRKSDLATASRKNGQLRGESYPLPPTRSLAFALLVRGWSFRWHHGLWYLPLDLRARLASSWRRRVRPDPAAKPAT